MKILIVLVRVTGGVGRANNEISLILRKKGHVVDILSREDHLKKFSFRKSLFPLRKRVRKLMDEKDYDFIYTQDYSTALCLLLPYPIFWSKHYCCYCGKKTGKHPTLVQWHHKLIHRIVGRMMEKKMVVIGDELKDLFPKSRKIYRGVNLKKFKPLNKKRDYIGYLEREYEGISEKELQNISNAVGLKLLKAKGIPPEKMNEFYNKCKIFISVPIIGGYNNCWNEAMAAGVPIIIGNLKGGGRVLPFDKILMNKDKINQIIKIIKTPNKRDYRKWIIENGFSWDDKAEELIDFFKEKSKDV